MLTEEKKLRKKAIDRKYYLSHREQKCASSRKWRGKHPQQVRSTAHKWYAKNIDKMRLCSKKWRDENPEKIREYSKKQYWNNISNSRGKNRSEKHKIDCKIWYQKHPEKIREYNAKRLSTPHGRINHRMRREIWCSLRRAKSGRHWETLVSFTLDELKNHLESLFTAGMTWGNMGKWHIDHKVPQSFFIFDKPEDQEFQYCWSLDNLQPLWAKDNLTKSKTIIKQKRQGDLPARLGSHLDAACF